nr:MAG TPA: hypothetical protein [Caudoviricetes sp.]
MQKILRTFDSTQEVIEMKELLEKLGISTSLQGEELLSALETEKQKAIRRFNNSFGNPAKEMEINMRLRMIEDALVAVHQSQVGVEVNSYSTGITARRDTFRIDDVTIETKPSDNFEAHRTVINNDELMGKGGEAYFNGDYETAFNLFFSAARNGDSGGMNCVALLFEMGYGVDADSEKAMSWYNKAANCGNASAMNQLGDIYRTGRNNVEVDYNEALKWFEMAAEANQEDAMMNLGIMYSSGEGVATDKKEGFQWYKKAADNGSVEALEYLGDIYLEGAITSQNYAEAFNCYMTAAENGYPYASYKLGIMFDNGMGMPASHSDAIEWYLKAADLENPDAQLLIGFAYLKGDCVEQDYTKSADYFAKAATQGLASAQLALGYMYEGGHGVSKNPFKAFECFKKSAEQGDNNAQYEMARCYANGIGIKQNYGEAVKWMRLAAAQKNEEAIEWLNNQNIRSNEPLNTYQYGSDSIGDYQISGLQHNDNLTGRGKLQYISGRLKGQYYEGEFVNGQINGNGIFYQSDGKQVVGNFKNGLNGYVKVYDKTRNLLFEGGFNGSYHGKGVYYNSDGSTFQGEWSNGQIISGKGTLRIRLNSGIIVKDIGTFERGNLQGRGKRYILSGEDAGGYWEGNFVNGALNGLCVFHNKQGGKQETECVNGVFHGTMRVYSAVGVFCWETVYKNGKEIGPRKESYIYRKSRGRT